MSTTTADDDPIGTTTRVPPTEPNDDYDADDDTLDEDPILPRTRA